MVKQSFGLSVGNAQRVSMVVRRLVAEFARIPSGSPWNSCEFRYGCSLVRRGGRGSLGFGIGRFSIQIVDALQRPNVPEQQDRTAYEQAIGHVEHGPIDHISGLKMKPIAKGI